jgi:hypothetical protein
MREPSGDAISASLPQVAHCDTEQAASDGTRISSEATASCRVARRLHPGGRESRRDSTGSQPVDGLTGSVERATRSGRPSS